MAFEKKNGASDEQILSVAQGIFAKHSDKFSNFIEVAFRRSCTTDEYGFENPKAFEEEFFLFLSRLAEFEPVLAKEIRAIKKMIEVFGKAFENKKFDSPIIKQLVFIVRPRFEEYCSQKKTNRHAEPQEAITEMSGVEFEHYLIRRLSGCGVTEIQTTPATGDQGADLLFSHCGVKVVVQAKRYASSVGNKAVQEVFAAKEFYKCDQAWVITNSTFTAPARTLAKQLGVLMLDRTDLATFEAKFSQIFNKLSATGS